MCETKDALVELEYVADGRLAATVVAMDPDEPSAEHLLLLTVVDLKIEDFKPEFAGKMNFYLNAVDELERQEGDAATIGLVLCPGRNKTVTQCSAALILRSRSPGTRSVTPP